jgi:hypothetical protein
MIRHNRKGPTVADSDRVKIRHSDTFEEREIAESALPFFVNQGFEVLTDKGNVSSSATAAAKKEN